MGLRMVRVLGPVSGLVDGLAWEWECLNLRAPS